MLVIFHSIERISVSLLKGLPSASGRQWSWINCAGCKTMIASSWNFFSLSPKIWTSQQDIFTTYPHDLSQGHVQHGYHHVNQNGGRDSKCAGDLQVGSIFNF